MKNIHSIKRIKLNMHFIKMSNFKLIFGENMHVKLLKFKILIFGGMYLKIIGFLVFYIGII